MFYLSDDLIICLSCSVGFLFVGRLVDLLCAVVDYSMWCAVFGILGNILGGLVGLLGCLNCVLLGGLLCGLFGENIVIVLCAVLGILGNISVCLVDLFGCLNCVLFGGLLCAVLALCDYYNTGILYTTYLKYRVYNCRNLSEEEKKKLKFTLFKYSLEYVYPNNKLLEIKRIYMKELRRCEFAFPENISIPSGLKIFKCSGIGITSLPDLPSTLEELDCSYNNITSLPENLPSGLKILRCSHTNITSLPDLPSTLQELICLSTQITSLPELPSSLKKMNFTGSPLINKRNINESQLSYRIRMNELISKARCKLRSDAIHEELVQIVWSPTVKCQS